MIEIGLSNIIKNFGFSNVLNGLSLEIMTGDRMAIVGRNGSGKSTILKLISGEELPGQGSVFIRRGATVGYLEQIPHLWATDATTRDVLMEPFSEVLATERHLRDLEHRMATEPDADALDRVMRQYAHHQSRFEAQGGYEIEENLARISTGFGLEDFLQRPFNVLSGGQKTIVMLAATILKQPDILLLDEPTNHLDMRTLEWFEGLLSRYRGTVLIVSHDRYFLDKVAKKTAILDRGTCKVYNGNYSFSQQEQEREALIEFEHYKNQQKKIEAIQAAIKRFRDWGARDDNELMFKKAKMLERRLEKMEKLERPQLEKPRIPIHFEGERTGRDVLRLKHFDLSIAGLSLVQDANLTLFYKEKACLIGDNGTGKTTLIRAFIGEIGHDSGEAYIAPSAKIGYIPQEIRFADDKMTVVDAFRAEHPCPEGMARNILAKYFFFGEHVFKRVSALSGGEKVLLKLAILVQQEVNFLVLDEPTNHIDIETREMLEEALLAFDGTLLAISHDRYFIQKLAERIFLLENRGITVINGGYDDYAAGRYLAPN